MKPWKKAVFVCLVMLVAGLLLPQHFSIPVEGATKASYNAASFWYYPWGKSGTHKGVDLFAKEGTPVLSAVSGLVISTGQNEMGGNVVMVLGPKWRIHYYAHLQEIKTRVFAFVRRGEVIGLVGTSGNARGKPPHLHYSIVTLIPYPWLADRDHQGWKKMLYLNPILYLDQTR